MLNMAIPRLLYLLTTYLVIFVVIQAQQPLGYLGCFRDNNGDSLKNSTTMYWSNPNNSGEYCKSRCKNSSKRYASTQIWNCFCGDGFYKTKNSTGCNYGCPANPGEKCGDGQRRTLYDTWKCITNPCKNGATCNNINAERYTCTCRAGWAGIICDAEKKMNSQAIYIAVPVLIVAVVVGLITFLLLRWKRTKTEDNKPQDTSNSFHAVFNNAYVDHDVIQSETPVYGNEAPRKVEIPEGNKYQYIDVDIPHITDSCNKTSQNDAYQHLSYKTTGQSDPMYSHTASFIKGTTQDNDYSHIHKGTGTIAPEEAENENDNTYSHTNTTAEKHDLKTNDNDGTYNLLNTNGKNLNQYNNNSQTILKNETDYDHIDFVKSQCKE